ncbi:hypothetical protein [Lysinibacillus sp. RC79]|uniref:hypothetical protein n=1 Tax=Lysinibacillus sp. RC79 TaxID=3156296 RepID=UPI00351167A5
MENAGIELGVLCKKIFNDPTFNINPLDVYDFDVLYEKISNNPAFNVANLIPKNERYSMDNQEWYRTLSIEKRFKIVDVNIETELVFEHG